MKRRNSLQLLAAMPFAPLTARAQTVGKVGYVNPGPRADERIETLRNGLKLVNPAFAKTEIVVESANEPGRVAPLVARVMASRPTVFIAAGPAVLRLARKASDTVPIVAYDFETDPVSEGYAQSIARPGGSVTGLFLDVPTFVGKWIEFLRECMPQLKKIALLGDPSAGTLQGDTLVRLAGSLGIATEMVPMKTREDLAGAVAAVKERGAGAAILLSSPRIFVNARELAGLMLAHRLPAITMFAEFARAGGLLAYGPDLLGALRQAGTMAGKILAGATPATLPIERPTTFELVVNLATAERLGVTVPPALKARADEVIE
jgi:putative ABC transport system substrate-binding protein